LLQEVRDFEARGQLSDARLAANGTVTWAKTANTPSAIKAGAMELLAKLDFQSGDLEGAETHYRVALEMLNRNPHTSPNDLSRVRNDLASVAVLRGDYESARRLLAQGVELPSETKLEAYRLNNLGALAEARGDRRQADTFYTKALSILPENLSNERKIVEANLVRVKGSQ
jgi:Flp pilus assembly protein TadD